MIPGNSVVGGESVTVVARIPDHTGLVGQQGQIGDGGRQIQLELGLDPSEVARLPYA